MIDDEDIEVLGYGVTLAAVPSSMVMERTIPTGDEEVFRDVMIIAAGRALKRPTALGKPGSRGHVGQGANLLGARAAEGVAGPVGT